MTSQYSSKFEMLFSPSFRRKDDPLTSDQGNHETGKWCQGREKSAEFLTQSHDVHEDEESHLSARRDGHHDDDD